MKIKILSLPKHSFADGGDTGNGVTTFRGLKHGQFGLEGIPQGIAYDGLPNYVEGGGFDKNGKPLEGEIKYNDYVYSNRLKPNSKLLKNYVLPEKYEGLTYAEVAEKIQKESEDRPNDPVSKRTLDEMMGRLRDAQEEQRAKLEERRLARELDKMSTEEKAALMSSLEQPMAQQEGIDLSQPMYAKGGRLKEVNPKNIKLGYNQPSLTSQILFNAYMEKPALQGGKIAGSNSNYSLDINGNASNGYITDYTKYNNDGTISTYYRESDLNGNGFEKISNNSPVLKQIDRINLERSIVNPDYIYSPLNETIETFAKGGKIHIAKNKRGTFTAAAKKHGKSVQAFASQVLANKENYSPAMVKKANFARNSAKWSHKHDLGDYLFLRDNNDNTPWYDFNAEVRDNPLLPYLTSEGNTQVSPINNNPNINISYNLAHAYDEPNMANPIWRQGLFTNNLPKPTPVDYVTRPPYRPYFEQTEPNDTPNDTVNTDLLAQRLGESLRYMPVVGSSIAALQAATQPYDYELPNTLGRLARRIQPYAAPFIGGYTPYNLYDVNLGDTENIGLTARAINANRGLGRATQGALNVAAINAARKTAAQRNIAGQQANEANRLATDKANLAIDQLNANIAQAYDYMNQNSNANKINLLARAAEAADASRSAWSNMYNSTLENFFNQWGNVGRDNWNRNQMILNLKARGYDELAEMFGSDLATAIMNS